MADRQRLTTTKSNPNLRVAFVVGAFPKVSETFIINQVADLMEQGLHVEVFAYVLSKTDSLISDRFNAYGMKKIAHSLEPRVALSLGGITRAIPSALRFLRAPRSFVRALTYCWKKRSFRTLFKILPFVGRHFDVIHCHFGEIANRFLMVREALQITTPLVTTFYGYDVSKVFKECPADVYDRLKQECALFFVMSQDMKRRVLARGFEDERVKVLPVSIDVASYPFSERKWNERDPIELLSVGRFVEKKGLDDVIRAVSIVNKMTDKPFRCSLIGSGPLESQLRELAAAGGVTDKIDFKGYMKVEEMIELLPRMQIMIQPSKTASDGDME